MGRDRRAVRGRGARPHRAHLPRRGPPLRAGGAARPAARLGHPLRGPPRRRAGLAAARRRAPAQRDPHQAPRAPLAAAVRVLPRRRASAPAVHARHRRAPRGRRDRRALGLLAAPAGRQGALAGLPAAAGRPGLRRRGLARDGGLHPEPPRRVEAARRGDRRLRGVHAPVPRELERSRHPLAVLDGAEHDDLRRPRRPRRLEHLRGLGPRHAGQGLVGGPDRGRVHGLLALPAPGQPRAPGARRGAPVRRVAGAGGRRPAAARLRPAGGPRVGRRPLGVPPRLRPLAAGGGRLARGPRAARGAARHGRRGRVGLDLGPRARRVRPPRHREHAARLHGQGRPPPGGLERGPVRRRVGPARTSRGRVGPAAAGPRPLARLPALVRRDGRAARRAGPRRGAPRLDHADRRGRPHGLRRRGGHRRRPRQPRAPGGVLAVPEPARPAPAAAGEGHDDPGRRAGHAGARPRGRRRAAARATGASATAPPSTTRSRCSSSTTARRASRSAAAARRTRTGRSSATSTGGRWRRADRRGG